MFYVPISLVLLTPGKFGPRKVSFNLGVWYIVFSSNIGSKSSNFSGGTGISKSVVWFTFVRPGRGSKAGIRAENCRFNTNSSSQHRRRLRIEAMLCSEVAMFLVSKASSSYRKIKPDVTVLFIKDTLFNSSKDSCCTESNFILLLKLAYLVY